VTIAMKISQSEINMFVNKGLFSKPSSVARLLKFNTFMLVFGFNAKKRNI
jgi:hypothetical protein